jgi:hypothetical protein
VNDGFLFEWSRKTTAYALFYHSIEMSLEEDEFTSVAWNTGATDAFHERSDEYVERDTRQQFGPSLTAGTEPTSFSVQLGGSAFPVLPS